MIITTFLSRQPRLLSPDYMLLYISSVMMESQTKTNNLKSSGGTPRTTNHRLTYGGLVTLQNAPLIIVTCIFTHHGIFDHGFP